MAEIPSGTVTFLLTDVEGSTALWEEAPVALGSVAYAQGHIPRAKALYDEGLSLYRTIGDRRGMAYQLRGLGRVANRQGDTGAAMTLLRESVSLF